MTIEPTTSENEEKKTANLHDNWNLQLLKARKRKQKRRQLHYMTIETYNFWKRRKNSESTWQLKPPYENKERKTAKLHDIWNLPLLKTKKWKQLHYMTIETYNFEVEKTATLHDNWNLPLLKTKKRQQLHHMTFETYHFWKWRKENS